MPSSAILSSVFIRTASIVRRSSGDIEALPSGISDTGGGAARAVEMEAASGRPAPPPEAVAGDCWAAATKGTRVARAERSADRADMNPRKIARKNRRQPVATAGGGSDRDPICESPRRPSLHPCRRGRTHSRVRHLQTSFEIPAPAFAYCCPRRHRRRQ
jgi:hypothetical protein